MAASNENGPMAVRREDGVTFDVEHLCTASIGVSLFTGNAAGTADVLKWAGSAVYRAKDAGRNTVRVHGDRPTP